ncbi:major capsid protein [Maribacter phage Colly_1]|uniref:Major capsid protein n=1 Tax=Maribacter phage Colly_1 TaxID=2745691 RepID=A0A8E4UY27_9CAUD|nr:major capsid protein [Maribacter phage Colly_1]QQO97357.1 major capsid protein [Maribacter phage Colly_1]
MKYENRMTEVLTEAQKHTAGLRGKYAKYMNPLTESLASKKRRLDPMLEATMLQLLNKLDDDLAIMEATNSGMVGSFIQHGYDLIMATYPNLVTAQIASIQPLFYKTGEIWFLSAVSDKAKGTEVAGTKFFDAKQGTRINKLYSSEYIDAVDDGDATVTTFNFAYGAELRTNVGDDFVVVTDGVETFTVDPSDNTKLVGSEGGTGTINAATGAVAVTFDTAPAVGTGNVVATAKVYFEKEPDQIGQVRIDLVSEPISAQEHKLITQYTLNAEFDLNRQFKMSLSDELIKMTSAQIRAEIDQLCLDQIKAAAKGNGTTSWSATVPSGVSETEHFRSILTAFQRQSNQIYKNTHMAEGTFIITGLDAATIIETLPSYRRIAKSSDSGKSGPYVAGEVGDYLHVKNPYYLDTEWVMGSKGNSVFSTGFILAPYSGLMVTPPATDANDPFTISRGLWLQAGRKVVNKYFYAYGVVTNFN